MAHLKKINRTRWKNNEFYFLLLLIPILIYTVIFVIPVIDSLRLSLYKWDGLSPNRTFVGFDNFKRLFTAKSNFGDAVINTIYYTCFAVIVGTVLSLLIAVIIYKPSKLNSALRTIFYTPGVLSTVAVGFIWSNAIYNPQFGVLNKLLEAINLGVLKHTWLGDKSTIIWAIAVVQVFMDLGTNVVIFIAGLQDIPADYYEAADIAGANAFQKFIYITLPSMKGVISLVVILSMIDAMKSFDLIYIMSDRAEVLSTFFYREMFTYGRVGVGCAAAIILMIMMMIFFALQKTVIKYED